MSHLSTLIKRNDCLDIKKSYIIIVLGLTFVNLINVSWHITGLISNFDKVNGASEWSKNRLRRRKY